MAKTSLFMKFVTGLCLCLGMAGWLLAASPVVNVAITGTLGPVIGGSGGVTSGSYVSGITGATGSSGETCLLSITGAGGSGATATVGFIGTNELGTLLTIETAGTKYSFTSPPTTATVISGGTGSCPLGGSITVTTKVDDPLGLNNASFQATTALNPVGVTYGGSTINYNNLNILFCTPNCTSPVLSLPCSGATGTFTINDGTDGGNDTFTVSNCTFHSIVTAAFTAKIAFPPTTIPAPIPLAFTTGLVNSPNTDSQGTYTITSAGTLQGVATILGISGSLATTCANCPAESLAYTGAPGNLTFTAQQGGSAPSQNVTVNGTPTENEPYAVTISPGASWLTVGSNAATTGGQYGTPFAVNVNPAGLTPGTYTGTLNVYSPASNSPSSPIQQTVTVSFTVTAASFTLIPAPSSFTFNSVNSASPAGQTLNVTTSTSAQVPFTVSASSTGGWLSVSPTSGTTGVTPITVTVNPALAPTGVDGGTITLTATGSTNSPTVAVTFNVTSIPKPASLSFTGSAGGSNPPSQPLTISATGPNVAFTASATTTSGGSWLSVSPTSGTTNGAALSVSVNTSGLAANTYNGSIIITPTGGAAISVPVTLTVSSLPSLVPGSPSFTFTSNAGAVPANQTLGVTSSSGSTQINYTVAASTSTGGSWLVVSPSSGTTPGSETLSIASSVLSGLATGSYSGSVTFTCSPVSSCGNANGLLTVPVTLNVTAALGASPTSLTFNYTLGGSTPASQPIGVTSNGGAITYSAAATTAKGGSWLTVSPGSATTPTGVTAALSAGVISGLQVGQYTGSITLTSSGATNSPVTVAVTLNVSSLPTLSVTGGPLTFNMADLGSLPGAQNLSVNASGGAAIPFTTSVSTLSGGSWLAASPAGGTTPGSLSVSILPNSLTAGTYTGSVQVSSSGASNSPQSVTVTLVVAAAPTLSVSPGSLTYNYTLLSGTNPASQSATVSASGGAVIPFTASATTTSGGNWLSVSPTSGNTPGSLSISVNPAGLTANTYSGTITVSSTQSTSAPQTIGVTFIVSAAPSLISSSGSLAFTYQTGGTTPASQPLTITSSGSALNFSATASTTSGGGWLSVSPATATTPGSLSVSLVPSVLTTLGANSYSGTITISSPQAGNPGNTLTIGVTLTVSSQPALTTTPSSLSFTYTVSGTVPGSQAVSIGTTGSSPLAGLTATTSTPWLSVSLNTTTTPATLTVSLVSSALSGLPLGPNSGSIAIGATGATSINFPVTLTVSSQPVLSVAPSALTFNGQAGGSSPAAQSLSVTSTGGSVSFTASAATVSGGSWLSVLPISGTTNSTVQVSVNSTGLVSGVTYTGSITVTGSGATGSPAVIPVTLTLSANALTATPSPLTFTYQLNGTAPASQTLSVASSIPGLAFSAASGASWLTVNPGSGTTPQALTVSIVTAGLTAQTYNSSITLTSAGNSPVVVPVSLTVSSSPPLTATPNSVSFAYSIGGTTPSSQSVLIAAGSTTLSFTATAATTSGGNWLAVTPASGTTPGSISISLMNLSGLTANTYNGTVTVSATGSASVVIPVTLTVGATPLLTVMPSTLSFSYTSGGTVPPGQSVAVATSNNAVAAFSVSAATSSGGNWLQVSPTNGVSPASVLASIVAGSYAAGTYNGTITVSAPGFTSATVAVTFVVTQAKAVIQVTGVTVFTLANTSAPATSTLSISASDGSAQAFTIAAAPTQNNWLSFSPTSGTTPASVTLTANPAGLIPGIYVTPFTVTMPGLPIPTKTIDAQLTISGSNLKASPSMLTFTYTPGSPLPAPQAIALTTVSGTGTVPLSSVTTDVTWLKVTPASSAPATLQVSISPGLLSAGTYSGDVIVKGVGSPDTSLEIPVTITINAAPVLTVAPTSLAFTYQIGGALPVAQSFALSTGNAQLNFTVTSPASWLQLSPLRGTTPGSVLVTANPLGLAPGTYTGAIGVTALGATGAASVAVTLTITGTPQLVVTPSQLTFSAPTGGPAPAAQTLSITSAGTALGFTAAAGSYWLSVTPTTGTTPAVLTVTANPSGLTAGTYTGTINITQAGAAQVSQMIIVTLQVGGGTATPTISGIINAASGVIGTVAPGMAISIFGAGLGPQASQSFALPASGGTVATILGGTQVMFDGTAVPIIYTSSTQVNALVPFEIANKPNTVLTVEYNGATSAGMTLPVVAAQPGLFTAEANGKGEGAILNQDNSVNSASNPAAAGSTIQLFGTGGGVTIPASVDGALNPLSSTGALAVTPTTATVGGQSAVVYYAGPAPTLVSGIFQIDVILPASTPSGNVTLVVTIGTAASQTITVAVQ